MEVDSIAVVALIHKPIDGKHPYGFVMTHVQDLMKRDWQVMIKHNYKESNRTADYFAARGHLLNLCVHFYLSSPPDLGDILRYDLVGIAMPELVT